MPKLPKKVTTLIPAEKILQIENWWNKLSPENQRELSSLYLQEQQSDPQLIAIQLCGQYVEQDYSGNIHNKFWLNEFYDYLVNHEIVYSDKPNTIYVGGTCSVHPFAQETFKSGLIPNEFSCPYGLSNNKCLMRHLLKNSNGRSLRLFVRFSLLE